jgi:segregation and condensation protein A
LTLYELLKSYSSHIMKKNFSSMNIPKLPVCTPELAASIIKKNLKYLNEWKDVNDLIPKKFKQSLKLKKTGVAGFFSASLELTKEGLVTIMQKEKFEPIMIKEKK